MLVRELLVKHKDTQYPEFLKLDFDNFFAKATLLMDNPYFMALCLKHLILIKAGIAGVTDIEQQSKKLIESTKTFSGSCLSSHV